LSKDSEASAQEVVDELKAKGVVVTAALVYNVKASAKKKAAKRAAKAAASTNGSTGTKADKMREVAGGMAKPVRPKDVVAALKAQGVEVLHTQVSQVLAKMGMKKKRRRRRKAAVGATVVANNSLNIDDLVAAKKLVGQVGSIEKVKEALAALARLG
jgi:arginine repressor